MAMAARTNPLIYAHRGSSGEAPENTMAAFRLALEQGAQGIELDVQLTADGRLVVIHDETLDRTTSGSGLVVRHTYNQLRGLDASYNFPAYAGEPLPLLEEVLTLLSGTEVELNIELKNGVIPYEGLEEAAVRLIHEYGMERQVIFSSFNHYSMAKLARMAPEMDCAILYVAGLYEPWAYAKPLGVRSLHPLFYGAVPEIVQGAHQAGMKVRPYTVDEEADIRQMIRVGVDAVITNYPARMKHILESDPV